jgi:hypothetical protein
MVLKSSRVKWGFISLLLSVLALSSCGSNKSSPVGGASLAPPSPPVSSASAHPSAMSSPSSPIDEMGRGMKPNADGQCATDESIKGKLTKNGNKIYHEPGSLNYKKVKATECFKTAADAEKAGYRPMKPSTTHKTSETKTKN